MEIAGQAEIGPGFGDVAQPIDACTQPPGTVSNASDCDDDNPLGYPGADEICDNGLNDDCDDDLDIDEEDCVPAPTDTGATGDTASPTASPAAASTGDTGA